MTPSRPFLLLKITMKPSKSGHKLRPSKSPGFGLYLPVSRLIKANLPVITNLLNHLVSLPLSPVFFAIRLLLCISPNFSYWKTRIESLVIRNRFWIGFLFTSDWKFRRWWNHLQNVVEKCTRRFIKLLWKTCMPFINEDSGTTVQLVKALLSAPISLFWDKNSQFLMEPKFNLQILEIFSSKVCKLLLLVATFQVYLMLSLL